MLSFTGKRTLLDAHNQPALQMERKFISLRNTWSVNNPSTGQRIAKFRPSISFFTPCECTTTAAAAHAGLKGWALHLTYRQLQVLTCLHTSDSVHTTCCHPAQVFVIPLNTALSFRLLKQCGLTTVSWVPLSAAAIKVYLNDGDEVADFKIKGNFRLAPWVVLQPGSTRADAWRRAICNPVQHSSRSWQHVFTCRSAAGGVPAGPRSSTSSTAPQLASASLQPSARRAAFRLSRPS
jgi:hypothetical protein